MLTKSETKMSLTIKRNQIIYLEDEHFENAKNISDKVKQSQQWQCYLNVLGLSAFEYWLQERLDENVKLSKSDCSIYFPYLNLLNAISNLKIGDFKICLIIIDHLLDEIIIPKIVINSSDFKAHLYVVIEVKEELEETILIGFIRYDQLIAQQNLWQEEDESSYRLPLTCFDVNFTHFLVYLHCLEASAILLTQGLQPVTPVSAIPVTQSIKEKGLSRSDAARSPVNSEVVAKSNPLDLAITQAKQDLINLSQWFQDVFTNGWQPEVKALTPNIVGFRSIKPIESEQHEVNGAKVIRLGMQMPQETVVLILRQKQLNETEIEVNLRLYPSADAMYLPDGVKLEVLDENGNLIPKLEAQARTNNWIPLKFTGEKGDKFCVKISLEESSIIENFLL